ANSAAGFSQTARTRASCVAHFMGAGADGGNALLSAFHDQPAFASLARKHKTRPRRLSFVRTFQRGLAARAAELSHAGRTAAVDRAAGLELVCSLRRVCGRVRSNCHLATTQQRKVAPPRSGGDTN